MGPNNFRSCICTFLIALPPVFFHISRTVIPLSCSHELVLIFLVIGGFHLVDLIIMELKDHMTCYKFKCSHRWKIYSKKNPLQDLLSSLNAVISTNERNWILTGHVTFKLRYNQIYQMKTTILEVKECDFSLPFALYCMI